MKRFIRVFSLFLVAVTLCCGIQVPASAANNVCVAVTGSASNSSKWTTITVKTGKNWLSNKITFSQDEGKMHYGANTFEEKTYGAYTIKVTNQETGKTKTYYWKYKANYTVKLDDNTTYTIKIKPYQPETVGDQNLKWSKSVLWDRMLGVYDKDGWSWSSAPTWRVKSTKAVSWCYSAG